MNLKRIAVGFAAAATLVGLGVIPASAPAHAVTGSSGKAAPPATKLGIYETTEDNTGAYPTSGWENGESPDVAPTYLQWGQGLQSAFVSAAESAGTTPMVEIEPWKAGSSYNVTPSFSNIASNGDSADNNCSLDNSSYSTNCQTWLKDLGTEIANGGKPVILTFGHEFNVSGQYPWSQGDTGSCGSSSCTPAQWIAAWDSVVATVNSTANNLAYWMWAPNTNTGGSTIDPTPYWPGASEVDMVGVDGYPTTQYSGLGTFSGDLGTTFSEIHALTSLPIFLSETNLAQMENGGGESISSFISDLCSNGGDGFLEFDDANWGLPSMTAAQWTEANNAMSADCGGGSGGGGGGSSGQSGLNPVSAGNSQTNCFVPYSPSGTYGEIYNPTVSSIESTIGGNINCLSSFDNPVDNWTDWETPWQFHNGSPTNGQSYNQWVGAGNSMLLGVDLVPQSADGAGWEASCAAGNFNSYATQLATNLVSYGAGHITIRLGIEANGSWEADYVGSDTADWAKCYQNEVTVMRAVSGAHFLFVWNPAVCYSSSPADQSLSAWYPGNAYVDIIGADTYDTDCNGDESVAQEGWSTFASSGAPSLDSVQQFAEANNKPFAIPEWGLQGTDDPAYVNGLSTLLHSTTSGWSFQDYFDNGDDGISELTSAFPNSVAAYNADFVAGGGSGTPTPTPTPTSTTPAHLTHVADSTYAQGTGSTLTDNYTSAPGDVLVAYLQGYVKGDTPVSATSVSDSAGDSWTIVPGAGSYDSTDGYYGYSAIAYTPDPTGEVTNVTAHWSTAPTDAGYIGVSEFAGAPNGVTVDASANATTFSSGTSYTTSNISTANEPDILLGSAAQSGAFTSMLHGNITDDGQGAWAITNSTGNQNFTYEGSSTNNVISSQIVALEPATSTPPVQQAPAVTSAAASGIGTATATLNGTVNPEGAATTYQFDYGTTTSYGSSTTSASAGAGTSGVAEDAPLSSLASGTTYHYRIEATNSAGTTYGSDQSFTTTAASSSASTGFVKTTAMSGAGYVMDDPAGTTANSTGLQVSSGNDAAGDVWTYTPVSGQSYGTLNLKSSPSDCADVHYGGDANGTVVDIYTCNGTPAQEWQPLSTGTLEAVGATSGAGHAMVLDDRGGGGAGSALQIWQVASDAQQQWMTPVTAAANTAATGVTSTTDLNAGLALDDPSGSTSNGTPLYTSAGNDAGDVWKYTPVSGQSYGTLNLASNTSYCADVHFGGDTNGTIVDIYTCNGTSSQEWQPLSNGTLEAVGATSGAGHTMVLDDPSGGGAGTEMQIYQASGTPQQQWQLP